MNEKKVTTELIRTYNRYNFLLKKGTIGFVKHYGQILQCKVVGWELLKPSYRYPRLVNVWDVANIGYVYGMLVQEDNPNQRHTICATKRLAIEDKYVVGCGCGESCEEMEEKGFEPILFSIKRDLEHNYGISEELYNDGDYNALGYQVQQDFSLEIKRYTLVFDLSGDMPSVSAIGDFMFPTKESAYDYIEEHIDTIPIDIDNYNNDDEIVWIGVKKRDFKELSTDILSRCQDVTF